MHCIIVRNQISGYLYSLRSSGNTHTDTHTHNMTTMTLSTHA